MSHLISIIIPTFNEQGQISKLISAIRTSGIGVDYEIIVADGGSTDNTAREILQSNAILARCPQKGRAAQMNYGATKARGDILFFLHADSTPPKNILHYIRKAISEGFDAGCFRLRFDSKSRFLKANAWLTRFDVDAFRFGDQGLFVRRRLFERLEGYQEDMIVLEDQEMVKRLKREGARFTIIPDYITTSARKYEENGPVRLQYVFLLVWINHQLGKSQQELVNLYKRRIKDSRINESDTAEAGTAIDGIHQKSDPGKSENTAG